MTPYNAEIFAKLEAMLAEAAPRQIERLLSDIATGQYSETAQTRAGDNDDQTNVTGINDRARVQSRRLASRTPCAELSAASRDTRRQRYSS